MRMLVGGGEVPIEFLRKRGTCECEREREREREKRTEWAGEGGEARGGIQHFNIHMSYEKLPPPPRRKRERHGGRAGKSSGAVPYE